MGLFSDPVRSQAALWRGRVALGCFCPPQITKPRTLTVRRGSPVRPPSHLTKVATVPRLFRVIQKAIDARVVGLTALYRARGVPKSIAIDVSGMVADEESAYKIAPVVIPARQPR